MSKLLYAENERALCFHGPLMYEAKILKAEMWSAEDNKSGATGPHYLVHYKGWKVTWDEYVPESRLLKLTESNLEKQKQLTGSLKAREKVERDNAASTSKPEKETKGKKSEAGRGTKRGRESVAPVLDQEDEWRQRPEIKLTIPASLKVQLVDDWEAVTKNSQLVPLPREPSVQDILKAYQEEATADAKAPHAASLTQEVVSGLQLYFDKCLGNNLLYRFERGQYSELRKKHGDEKEMSEIYGAEHLLRLFVNLPELIAHTTMDAEGVAVLQEAIADMLKWLARDQAKYFLAPLDAYDHVSTDYVRLANS